MKRVKRKKSVTNKIISVNFVMMLIMTVIVCFAIFIILCYGYNQKLFARTDAILEEQKAKILNEVDVSIHKTNLIVKNTSILKMLNAELGSVLQKTEFTNTIKVYMDTLEDVRLDLEHQLKIYSANDSLFEGQYIKKMSRFRNKSEVLRKMQEQNTSIVWLDDITWSGEDAYLFFYRKLPIEKESYIEGCIKLDVDFLTPDMARVEIKKKSDEAILETESENSRLREVHVFNGWYLLSEISLKSMYGQYFKYLCLLTFFMILIIILVYFVSKKSVQGVIQAISDLLENISENTVRERNWKPETNFWEFEAIFSRTQNLIKQVDELEKQYYENELMRKKVEIELLNYKLNPHMLYNSLSAINLVAYKENYKDVRRITNIMIDYYRDVLAKDCDIVTVNEEISLIDKFVKISCISRNQNFALEVELEDGVLNMPIPHMLFQPIVENSIMHGFNNCDVEAVISITGRVENDYLVFLIADNGKGMNEEQLKRLNSLECRGYGVKNTARRIRFYYGDDCGVSFESEAGKGTKAIVKIHPKIFGLSMYSEGEA